MAPMLVMGLFGFLGKAVKGIAKGVGKVAKVGVGVAKFGLSSGLVPIPGGGLLGKVAGGLVAAKRPMAPVKLTGIMGGSGRALPQLLRAKSPPSRTSVARIAQLSPVLPGGAIATPSGPRVNYAAAPPLTYSGQGSGTPRKRRKRTGRKRSTAKRRRGSRKLKFGSPAWRKKYLGHGKKRRRRRAA